MNLNNSILSKQGVANELFRDKTVKPLNNLPAQNQSASEKKKLFVCVSSQSDSTSDIEKEGAEVKFNYQRCTHKKVFIHILEGQVLHVESVDGGDNKFSLDAVTDLSIFGHSEKKNDFRESFPNMLPQKLTELIRCLGLSELDKISIIGCNYADTHGNDQGDSYLKELANKLREAGIHAGIKSYSGPIELGTNTGPRMTVQEINSKLQPIAASNSTFRKFILGGKESLIPKNKEIDPGALHSAVLKLRKNDKNAPETANFYKLARSLPLMKGETIEARLEKIALLLEHIVRRAVDLNEVPLDTQKLGLAINRNLNQASLDFSKFTKLTDLSIKAGTLSNEEMQTIPSTVKTIVFSTKHSQATLDFTKFTTLTSLSIQGGSLSTEEVKTIPSNVKTINFTCMDMSDTDLSSLTFAKLDLDKTKVSQVHLGSLYDSGWGYDGFPIEQVKNDEGNWVAIQLDEEEDRDRDWGFWE